MKVSLLGLSVVLAGALAAACTSGDQNATNSGGNGGAGASTGAANAGGDNTGGKNTGGKNTGGDNTGGKNTGGDNTGGKNTGGDNTGGASTGGSNTGGTGGTGGSMVGGPCGGIVGDVCDPAQYCDYDDDTCGNADGAGTCTDVPDTCPDNDDPVCACDGQTYDNACKAAAAGVDLSQLGACPAPPGTFTCGSSFCDTSTEYCQVDTSDVPGLPSTSTCNALPGNCEINGATCACLADLPCANMCEETGGGLTITCPGG